MIASNILNAMGSWFNQLTGQGGGGDHGGSSGVVVRMDKTHEEISELLAHAPLIRIACSAFAEDIVRAWRVHSSAADRMLSVEEQYEFRDVVEKAMFFAESYGGAFLIPRYAANIVDEKRLATERGPLRNGLLGFEVYAQHELRCAPYTEGMRQPNGLPMYYTLRGNTNMKIHHSWVHPVKGPLRVPSTFNRSTATSGITQLGQSRVDIIYDDFARMSQTYSALSHVLAKGNIDVLKIKGFAEALARCADDAQLQTTLQNSITQATATVTGANTYQPIVIDADEDLERKGGNHAGAPDIARELKTMFIAATRIPATKFGEQAKGINNGGEADLTNYYDVCASLRERRTTSLLNWMDKVAAPTIRTKWEYKPLYETTEKDKAALEAVDAEIDIKYSAIPGVNAGIYDKLKKSGRYKLAAEMPQEEETNAPTD